MHAYIHTESALYMMVGIARAGYSAYRSEDHRFSTSMGYRQLLPFLGSSYDSP